MDASGAEEARHRDDGLGSPASILAEAAHELEEAELLTAGGEGEEALAAAGRARALFRQAGGARGEGDAAHLLARLRLAEEEPGAAGAGAGAGEAPGRDAEAAAELAGEAREAYARAAHRRGEVEALVTAANALIALSHSQAAAGTARPLRAGAPNFRAVRAAKEAQAIALKLKDAGLQAVAHFTAARSHALNEKVEQALRFADWAARCFEQSGDRLSQAFATFFLAQVHMELGGKDGKQDAQDAVDRALAILHTCGGEQREQAMRDILDYLTSTLQGGQAPLLAGNLYSEAAAVMLARHVREASQSFAPVRRRRPGRVDPASCDQLPEPCGESEAPHDPQGASDAESWSGDDGKPEEFQHSVSMVSGVQEDEEEKRAREAQEAAEAAARQAEEERMARAAAAAIKKAQEEALEKERAELAALAKMFRKGDKVRLNAKGCDQPADHDWSSDAIRPGDIGEVLSCRVVGSVAEVFLKGPNRRTDTYNARDLEKHR